MSKGTYKYYHGTVELANVWTTSMRRFAVLGGKRTKHNEFKTCIGTGQIDGPAVLPVTRAIYYSNKPSLHKCDARCRHAKGNNCECSCGGANHGAGD